MSSRLEFDAIECAEGPPTVNLEDFEFDAKMDVRIVTKLTINQSRRSCVELRDDHDEQESSRAMSKTIHHLRRVRYIRRRALRTAGTW